MVIKVIKTEPEYEAALAEIEKLIEIDPEPGTPEADRLELLTLIVQEYESKNFPIGLPDPIDAIEYRMEQQNLTQRDLIPYIGSRSKVSEILSRKRPLTISMIRALSSGLGIPAKVLLKESTPLVDQVNEIEWERFPVREMMKRGWIKTLTSPRAIEQAIREFCTPLNSATKLTALYKKTIYVRSARPMDNYALLAWKAQIVKRALAEPLLTRYKDETLTLDFMRQIAQLSVADNGPLLARDLLSENGISLVIEPHLPRTHLDGAAILIMLDRPVIGMTIRHDRIDNFWFCLMHELAHISLHFGSELEGFYDDLDFETDTDPREQEADELAREALISREKWMNSPASRLRSPEAAIHLANQLHIHPAIVAGRIRHYFKSYRVLNQLVGQGKVRSLFPEIHWEV